MDEIEEGIHIAKRSDMYSMHPDFDPADDYGFVVCLCDKPVNCIDYHIPLIDGVNKHSDFVEAVDTVLEGFESDSEVVVFCNAGQSRSASILSTALAVKYSERFETAADRVREAHDPTSIREPLREHAKEYLGYGDLAKYLDESIFDRDIDVIMGSSDTSN